MRPPCSYPLIERPRFVTLGSRSVRRSVPLSTALSPHESRRTLFIGRVEEQRRLVDALRSAAALLTVTGPSGMGKTWLAKRAAAEVEPRFRDLGGSFFCNLSACRSASDLQAVVAAALEIPQQEGQALARAIANRGPTLLVLDNLDGIATDAVPLLLSWLDRCAELQLLITSIVPLGLEEELRFELGPLTLADGVELYLERAKRAWAGKSFSDDELRAIEELVGRLDGIPLAIELAAARVRLLPPRNLLARIGERFELLQVHRPGHQASLQRALSLTFEYLSEDERRLLGHASLFEGGFTLEAAEAVLGPLKGEAILSLLDELRSKTLLQLDDSDPPRFSLYESVREFAASQFRSDDQWELIQAHATFYLEQGEVHAGRILGPEPLPSLRWLMAERENLIAAQRRTFEQDPSRAARLGLALSGLLGMQGPPASEAAIQDATLDAARRSEDPQLLLRALRARAATYTRQGNSHRSRLLVDEGLGRARSSGDELEIARLLTSSSWLHTLDGEYERARAELMESVEIAERLESPLVLGPALLFLAALEAYRGALQACEQFLSRAQEIFRGHGSLEMEGTALFARVTLLVGAEHYEEARYVLEQALAVARRLSNRNLEAAALTNLGGLEATAGELEAAEAHLAQGLRLSRMLGDRRAEAVALSNFGLISLQRAEQQEGIRALLEAKDIYQETGDRRFHAEVVWFLALAHAELGKTRQATSYLQIAREFFEAAEDETSEARCELIGSYIDWVHATGPGSPASPKERAELETIVRTKLQELSADVRSTENLIIARRLLERAIDLPHEGTHSKQEELPRVLRVASDGSWFELEGRRSDLRRRGSLRRIMQALAETRATSPGSELSPESLYDVGWRGEAALPDSASRRVYSAIWALRTMGLEGILLRHADGYLLDPSVAFSSDEA